MDFKFGRACRVVIDKPDSDGNILFKVIWDETCTFEWYIGFQSILVLRWLDDDKDVKFMLDGTKELRSDSEYMQKIIDYLKKLGQNNFRYIPFDDPAGGLETFDEDDLIDI